MVFSLDGRLCDRRISFAPAFSGCRNYLAVSLGGPSAARLRRGYPRSPAWTPTARAGHEDAVHGVGMRRDTGHRDLRRSRLAVHSGALNRETRCMQAYLARRLLALIPALFFASLIVFVIVRLVPGDIIDMMLSQNDVGADKLSRDQLINTLGLDRPMWEQYSRWIGGILLHGDFGRSLWQNTPVAELLRARMPVTFQLGLMAMIVALCVAIPIGIYSAIRQDTAGDYLTRSFSILMLAVPSFWMGTMVMVFPSIWWGWSPQVRFLLLRHLVQNLGNDPAGDHPRHRAVGDHHAPDADHDAGSAAAGVHPHRLGRGPFGTAGGDPPRACATRSSRW